MKNGEQSQNAVLYIRVSSKEQAEGGYSLEAQDKLLKAYARDKGLKIVYEFKDEETAKESGRKAFNEMLLFLQENPSVKYLLVEKTDRLSRNFRDIATLEDLMNSKDMHIVLVKENTEIHKDSRSNEKFMFGIRAVMAKHFIDNLSEETKKGLNQKAESGHYPGLAPLGYRNISDPNDPKKRIVGIDSNTAPLARELFKLYATGRYSYEDLTNLVNKTGLRSRLAKPLHRSRIEKLLKDPFYYGYFLWGGKLYKGRHAAIVSSSLFDYVQRVMKKKSHHMSGSRGAEIAYRGLVRCTDCGCAITGERKRKASGKEYILYHCTNYYRKCKSKKQYYNEDELDKILGSVIRDLHVNDEVYGLIKTGLRSSADDLKATSRLEKKNYHEQKETYEQRLHKLYLDRVDGVITDDFYHKMHREWQAELDAINQNLASYDHADKKYYDRGVLFLEYARKISEYWKALNRNSPKERILKGQLLKVLLADARLADGALKYQFRKPFDELAKLLGSKQKEWGPECCSVRTPIFRAPSFIRKLSIASSNRGKRLFCLGSAPPSW